VIDEFEDAHAGAGYEYHVAGEPAITVLLSRNMQADIATLIPSSFFSGVSAGFCFR